MSFYDILLAKKIGGGGGGSSVTVEALSVTSNGTYSETGKAYSPVSVNVPQPSGSTSISENGTYDVTAFAEAVVNVSGGSFTPMFAAIRPDAEIAYSFQYDKLAVQDLGITIPEYQTSWLELVAANTIMDGVVIDVDNYDYFVYMSVLAYPIKTEQVHQQGAFEYHCMNIIYNPVYIPNGTVKSLDGNIANNSTYGDMTPMAFGANVYDTSSSALGLTTATSASSLSWGLFTVGMNASFNKSAKKLTVKAPGFRISGSAAYFNQTDWGRMVDIRMQYKINVYRVPRSGNRLDGWSMNMGFENAAVSIANGGTLQ